MTLTEFKKKIDESSDPVWLNGLSVNLNYAHINYKQQLNGITAIMEFVSQQIDGWNKLGDHLPRELDNCKNQFESIQTRILQLIAQSQNFNTRNSYWSQISSMLNPTNIAMFIYNCPETDFLIKTHKQLPHLYPGAYSFILGSFNASLNNKNNFTGAILASDFLIKDYSEVTSRVESEKKSITQIREDFQKYLSESESEVTAFKERLKDKNIEYNNTFDETISKNNSSFEDWFESTKKHFIDFNTSSNSAIKDLEKIYEEKLRLQKPAEYWNLRASTLRKEGYNWLKCLIISVIVGIITLVWVINRISTEKFETIFANTSIAVKWSLAIISLISFIAYIIRIFSKLTFSSFHLVRDAEEREQLTYFYLALQKEKNIDQTERHLIMQSLFSRVDSGLLKEDSSPTMPGNIVDQITKK
ncbi:MAG: DUF6161 domain-containing protein [Chitinophagales bacterium]